jgi:hypothetical protein
VSDDRPPYELRSNEDGDRCLALAVKIVPRPVGHCYQPQKPQGALTGSST